MKLIHVVHVQKFNKRHMPEQFHYVGTVRELASKLAGYQQRAAFETVQELLGHLRNSDVDKDFDLVHSYEEVQSAVISSQISG